MVYAYVIIAALVLIMGAWFLGRRSREDATTSAAEHDLAQGLWEGRGLDLAERIFDSRDYHWLRDEIRFPQLAQALAQSRKRLAIQWLRALRASFDALARSSTATPPGLNHEGWMSLWRVLRFHLLIAYALLVVHWMGPYHRLMPPLGWVGGRIRSRRPARFRPVG